MGEIFEASFQNFTHAFEVVNFTFCQSSEIELEELVGLGFGFGKSDTGGDCVCASQMGDVKPFNCVNWGFGFEEGLEFFGDLVWGNFCIPGCFLGVQKVIGILICEVDEFFLGTFLGNLEGDFFGEIGVKEVVKNLRKLRGVWFILLFWVF